MISPVDLNIVEGLEKVCSRFKGASCSRGHVRERNCMRVNGYWVERKRLKLGFFQTGGSELSFKGLFSRRARHFGLFF